MPRFRRIAQSVLLGAVFANRHAPAQQPPPQFKASVRVKNGSDGTTAAGTMYFGGSKMRAELKADGQEMVVLADPAAKSQYLLMPGDKMFMQMPIGQGPVSLPVTGGSDPTNPCSSGGNTDCTKGENESVNGYQTVRWDYTAKDGTRTRAWVSPRLRFAIKTQDDNGSSMELSNIAEGPQDASLFSIPSGYTKVDVGMMAGMSGGRGRGRGNANSNDPVAAMMANLPAEQQAAMAAAMRGDGPKGLTGVTGSGWEKTKGWVINITVTGTGSRSTTGEAGTTIEKYVVKLTGSIPLNLGTPSAGVPNAPGPFWQLMYTDALGTPEALATPATFAAEVDGRIDHSYKGACGIGEDPFQSVGIVKGTARASAPITQRSRELDAEGLFKMSADLKTYDLAVSMGTEMKETTQTRTDSKSCRDGNASTTNETKSTTTKYGATIDLKELPLPAAVGPVTGSKKMPMVIAGRDLEATVAWTIAPIR